MKCDEARMLMSESLDQRLDESSNNGLQAHLLTCSDCLARWQGMRHAASLFEASDLAMPPPDFTAQVMKRLQQAERARTAPLFERRPVAVGWAMVAATAILLVATLALYSVRSPVMTANSAAPSIDVPAVAMQISGEAIGGAILFENVVTVAYQVARLLPQATVLVILGWMMVGTLALAVTLAGVVGSYWPQPEAVS
jgi:predicted anti-sigma-YlaC factor YlaD